MDGAIDAASPEQGGVGGIDDRVGFAARDIAFHDLDPIHDGIIPLRGPVDISYFDLPL